MLAAAPPRPNISYVERYAHHVPLAEGSVDIVTCSQSFHWMEPEPVIAEVSRLLRPGGIFAIYDYVWPPLIDWRIEQALASILARCGLDLARPEKAAHGDLLRGSGRFRHVREVHAHSCESVTGSRFVALARSNGAVARKLFEGISAYELGLTQLQALVEQSTRPLVAFWPYHGWVAVR